MNHLQVADLDWLTPHLAVGGDLHPNPELAAAQVRWLVSQGVTDIIDCRQEWNDADIVANFAPGITYHHLPTDDHGGEINASWWFEGILEAQSTLSAGGSVFVHCHMGINRGPSMAFAILVDQGWRPIEAFDLIRSRRPQAFAIYAPQVLRLLDRREDARALEAIMARECDHEALAATIGRVRTAENNTGYRFPLAS